LCHAQPLPIRDAKDDTPIVRPGDSLGMPAAVSLNTRVLDSLAGPLASHRPVLLPIRIAPTPPMQSITAATLGLILVIIIPGVAITWLLAREKVRWWEAAAIAPAVGLGFTYAIAEVTSLVGLRFDLPVFAIASLGLIAAVVGKAVRSRARSTRTGFVGPRRSEYTSIALLGAGIVMGASIWAVGLRGVETPPNFDASHHGLFTAQIDRSGSIDADRVLVSSSNDSEPVSAFYPLALHSAGALVSGPAPTTVADIWLVYAALFAAIGFPIGVFAIARVLFPETPLAAGFAAFLAPTAALFPYKPIAWGGIALIAGMAMMPGVLVAAARVLVGRVSLRQPLYVALALVGLFASHSSEVPLAIGLALLVAAMSVRALGAGVWIQRVPMNGALIGAFSIVLLAPVLVAVFRGGGERVAFDDTALAPLGSTIRSMIDLTAYNGIAAPAIVILAAAGAAVALARRAALIWLATGAAVVALYLLSAVSDHALVAGFSFPWYRQPERILYNVVFWLLPFAGYALASATMWVSRRGNTQGLTPVAVVGVAILALTVSAPSVRQIPPLVQSWGSLFSPVGSPEIAAFEFLEDVTEPGEIVMTDVNADGSLWMYAYSGVEPLFLAAASNLSPDSALASFRSHQELAGRLDNYRTDPEVLAELQELGIRYVYYDETGFLNAGRTLDYQVLRSDPAFIPVFEQEAVHVYRIDYDVLAEPDRYLRSKPLLIDGGFDRGLAFWAPDSNVEQWSVAGSDDPVMMISDSEGQTVLYAMQNMAGRDPSWDVLAVPPGAWYSVSFELRPVVQSEGRVAVGVLFFDAAGEPLESSGADSGDVGSLGTGTWHEFSQTFVPPPGAVQAVPVVVAVDISGAIKIDNIDLRVHYG
jgi:hypothetical protein